jgi:hypothetical protein
MQFNQEDIIKKNGKVYYKTKRLPTIPLKETDEYIITTIGDNMVLLSEKYYEDPELWQIILVANNNITKGSIFPIPGTQLRIPIEIAEYRDLFKK